MENNHHHNPDDKDINSRASITGNGDRVKDAESLINQSTVDESADADSPDAETLDNPDNAESTSTSIPEIATEVPKSKSDILNELNELAQAWRGYIVDRVISKGNGDVTCQLLQVKRERVDFVGLKQRYEDANDDDSPSWDEIYRTRIALYKYEGEDLEKVVDQLKLLVENIDAKDDSTTSEKEKRLFSVANSNAKRIVGDLVYAVSNGGEFTKVILGDGKERNIRLSIGTPQGHAVKKIEQFGESDETLTDQLNSDKSTYLSASDIAGYVQHGNVISTSGQPPHIDQFRKELGDRGQFESELAEQYLAKQNITDGASGSLNWFESNKLNAGVKPDGVIDEGYGIDYVGRMDGRWISTANLFAYVLKYHVEAEVEVETTNPAKELVLEVAGGDNETTTEEPDGADTGNAGDENIEDTEGIITNEEIWGAVNNGNYPLCVELFQKYGKNLEGRREDFEGLPLELAFKHIEEQLESLKNSLRNDFSDEELQSIMLTVIEKFASEYTVNLLRNDLDALVEGWKLRASIHDIIENLKNNNNAKKEHIAEDIENMINKDDTNTPLLKRLFSLSDDAVVYKDAGDLGGDRLLSIITAAEGKLRQIHDYYMNYTNQDFKEMTALLLEDIRKFAPNYTLPEELLNKESFGQARRLRSSNNELKDS
ncbi:hypothetical protein FWC31_01870 [Candidatus Saccharibacteria bacterium]|nr:hypothetical protein [Candidatus Saccharibacteria bacterium]